MAPLITFPDVVALALLYVRTMLADASITVAATVPATRPTKLVTLRLAGGSDRLHGILARPRIDAVCWRSTEFDALALAERVRSILRAAPGRVDGVSASSTFAFPFPAPDPASGNPRALTTVQWQVRGLQLPES